jgi:endonuclease I
VLGQDWEVQQEGANLKRDCENLKTRITRKAEETFKNWHKEVSAIEFEREKDKTVFKIEQRGQKFSFSLNFNE